MAAEKDDHRQGVLRRFSNCRLSREAAVTDNNICGSLGALGGSLMHLSEFSVFMVSGQQFCCPHLRAVNMLRIQRTKQENP